MSRSYHTVKIPVEFIDDDHLLVGQNNVAPVIHAINDEGARRGDPPPFFLEWGIILGSVASCAPLNRDGLKALFDQGWETACNATEDNMAAAAGISHVSAHDFDAAKIDIRKIAKDHSGQGRDGDGDNG